MTKFQVSVVGLLASVALAVPALTARQQTSLRFEYLRLIPGLPGSERREGYQACQAKATEWMCREFASAQNRPDDGLRRAMATLGSEGWELVSIIDETVNLGYPKGPTFVFKRQQAQ